MISGEHASQDKVISFITQRMRVLLSAVCSAVTLKNIEEVFDLITPLFEGQSLEVIAKSCIVELIGSCLQKSGSSLQVAFMERYACMYLDICIPTIAYIAK